MSRKINIKDLSVHLFWDVNKDDFDFDKHKNFLIVRVLQYGNIKDWKIVKNHYSSDEIIEASIKAKSLDAVTLSYVSTIYNIDITKFKCYKNKQLHPNLWNS